MTGDRVADPGTILAAHEFRSYQWPGILCRCGKLSNLADAPPIEAVSSNEQQALLHPFHAAHQLAMLADAGWSLTRTPDREENGICTICGHRHDAFLYDRHPCADCATCDRKEAIR